MLFLIVLLYQDQRLCLERIGHPLYPHEANRHQPLLKTHSLFKGLINRQLELKEL